MYFSIGVLGAGFGDFLSKEIGYGQLGELWGVGSGPISKHPIHNAHHATMCTFIILTKKCFKASPKQHSPKQHSPITVRNAATPCEPQLGPLPWGGAMQLGDSSVVCIRARSHGTDHGSAGSRSGSTGQRERSY
jgi:hypothetical protein